MASLQPVQHQVTGTLQAKGFQAFFHQLPEKLATTVRVFDRGEYYTVHGSDAYMVAQHVFKTSTAVRQFTEGDSQLEYVTLSRRNFEWLVRDLLLVQRYRVEVYRCRAASTKSGATSSSDWTLEYQGSPGNVTQFEEVLYAGGGAAAEQGGGVIAVHIANRPEGMLVGAAVVDTTEQRMSVTEFCDSSDTLCSLEALVVQMAPRECVLCPSDPCADTVREIMSRNHVLVNEAKRSDFSDRDIAGDLERLLKSPLPSAAAGDPDCVGRRAELTLRLAMAALAAAIGYLQLMLSDAATSAAAGGGGGDSGAASYTLSRCFVGDHVRLDAAAVHALNLVASPLPGGATVAGGGGESVLSLFTRHAATGQGSRLLGQWLRQPLTDVRRIDERLDLVQLLATDDGPAGGGAGGAQLRLALAEQHLRRLPDLQRLCRRLQRRRASLVDCYRVYKAVQQIQSLIDCFDSVDERFATVVDANFVQPLKQCVQDFQKFVDMIESTMDLASADKDVYVVRAEFDEELQELRSRMDELETEFEKLLAVAADCLGLEQRKTIKLESSPQLGYYFRITRKEERVLRGQKEYQIVETNKGGVKFRCRKLERLNEQHQTCSRAFTEQQQTVVDEIVSIAAGYIEPIRVLNNTVAHIDAVVALATAAVSAPTPYVRPQLTPLGQKGVTELVQLRHPCVERQDGVSFIANDVHFEHDKSTFKVITGPNMAGKSTYIRSAAVAVIMAQMGSFVPCERARVCCVDAVMTRVGAGDCQARGLSTFMAEMLETAAILRSATCNSLLVIDELGRGTSTYDGFGLAWAISEHIVSAIGAFTLFASHYHELAELSSHWPCVHNLHVTALVSGGDDNNNNNTRAAGGAICRQRLTFLYRVAPGVCDRSFGVQVAEMVRFSDRVLRDARQTARRLEHAAAGGAGAGGGSVDTGDDGALVGGAKRARLQQQEGLSRIDKFLDDYDHLTDDSVDREQHVNQLMQQVRQMNDPFITKLLQRHALC